MIDSQYLLSEKYEGTFENGLRHGVGIYFYTDNSRYEGEFQLGDFHGQGEIMF